MKFASIFILTVLAALWITVANAQIYIWTDENGIKHYSDHPPANRKNVDVQVETDTNRQDEAADIRRTEAEQRELDNYIKEIDENFAAEQQEKRLKSEAAEKNRPLTQEEKIAAEQKRLEDKISQLEEQPLEYFGSQKNKRVRIGYYRYRLEALQQDPDAYFAHPESFEGNIKP